MAATLIPVDDLLVDPAPGSRITPSGRPTPEWRETLRKVPSLRNAFTVLSVYVQIALVLGVAVYLNHPVAWLLAFLLMGRTFSLLSILAHEAAHRILFGNRAWNDFIGRWFLAYPAFTPLDLYRRGHMGHHREEFGPNEPDIPLYRGYPISRDSFRRKLTRDALGITGYKLLKGFARGLKSENREVRTQAWRIVVVQIVIAALFVAFGHPWLYPLLWFLPYLTVWRVLNRLRAVAEHGGMERSPDRRRTTHTVRQSRLARFVFVPYHTGLHLAHHVDPGIPWRKLPVLQAELARSGYVQPELEYRSYPALWRALASG
jgi:fatty acid desaturase